MDPNGIVQSLHFTNSSNCLLCVQSCHPAPTRASWPNKCESRMAEIPWSDQITKCRRIKVFLWVLLQPMPQDAGLWKNYFKKSSSEMELFKNWFLLTVLTTAVLHTPMKRTKEQYCMCKHLQTTTRKAEMHRLASKDLLRKGHRNKDSLHLARL